MEANEASIFFIFVSINCNFIWNKEDEIRMKPRRYTFDIR